MDDEVTKHVIAETRCRNDDSNLLIKFLETKPPVLSSEVTDIIGTREWCNNMDIRFKVLQVREPLQLSFAQLQVQGRVLEYWKRKVEDHPQIVWEYMKDGVIRNFTAQGWKKKLERKRYRQILSSWKMKDGETAREYYNRSSDMFHRCPFHLDDDEAISVYWNGLSEFEKQRGKYRTYEPAPGLTYEDFLRHMKHYMELVDDNDLPLGNDTSMDPVESESEEDPSEDDPEED